MNRLYIDITFIYFLNIDKFNIWGYNIINSDNKSGKTGDRSVRQRADAVRTE